MPYQDFGARSGAAARMTAWSRWPISDALPKLTDTEEIKIAKLEKKAVS